MQSTQQENNCVNMRGDTIQIPCSCIHCANQSAFKIVMNVTHRQQQQQVSRLYVPNATKPLSGGVTKSSTSTPSTVNRHCCTICDASFSRKANLERHHLVHSGERNFACLTCGQTFSLNSNLKRHVLQKHAKMLVNSN